MMEGFQPSRRKRGRHVRADPFLADHAIHEAIELVADIVDGAAGRRNALEVSGMSASEVHTNGNAVPSRDNVVDVCFEVGERTLDHLEPL